MQFYRFTVKSYCLKRIMHVVAATQMKVLGAGSQGTAHGQQCEALRTQHDVRGLDLHVLSHTPAKSLINTHHFNNQYLIDENMH